MSKKKQRSQASGLPKGAFRKPNGTFVRLGPSVIGPNGRKLHLVVEQYEETDSKKLASLLIGMAQLKIQVEREQQDRDKAA